MREHVTLYKMDAVPRLVAAGWTVNPHGWFAWLHRFLWWALRKMNALAQQWDEKVDIIRLPVSNDEVLRSIMEAREGLFRAYRKPCEILIGPETLGELIGCPELRDWNSPFQFSARAGYDNTLFDLPIRVVPQMEGVVVLDKRP